MDMKKFFIKNLQNYFQLAENKTTIGVECIAGLTTFLTMSYIIFVNPAILVVAGIDPGAAFVATCLAAALGCFLTGIFANYPMAVAPGMGLNAYFAYTVVKSMGYSWQSALGMVFISGILFFLLTISKVRQQLIKAIPRSLIIGISAGIGLFLAMIGLKNVGIIISDPNTLVKMGNVNSVETLLFILGFCLIIVLNYFRILGAILLGMLAITALSLLFRINHFQGIFSLPPSISSTFFAFDLKNTFHQEGLVVIFAFFLIALFDSTGTLVGVLQNIQFNKDSQKTKRLSNALLADSIATMAGAALGTSTTTPYVESAAGVRAGGRTGLTAIVVAVLFLFALFFSPLAKTIPTYATAPALLYVACLMIENIQQLSWQDATEYVPGIITMIMVPFTFSIADGVGFGLMSYVLIKLLCGKLKDLNVTLFILAMLFFAYFILQGR